MDVGEPPLRPADLAAAAAGGLRELDVARRPVVAIVPTGDEVRPVGTRRRLSAVTAWSTPAPSPAGRWRACG